MKAHRNSVMIFMDCIQLPVMNCTRYDHRKKAPNRALNLDNLLIFSN